MGDFRNQDHQHPRECRDAEAGIDRSEQSQGCDCNRQHACQRDFVRVGEQRGDGAGINRAPERTHQIVDGRLQRLAEAHLRQDHRRQHRPQWQGNMQQV